jgi:hypothetical protein
VLLILQCDCREDCIIIMLIVPVHIMKLYGGVKLQLHVFLPLHYMEVHSQFSTPATLPQGKQSWYPSIRRLGVPQRQCSCLGEESKVLFLRGIKP